MTCFFRTRSANDLIGGSDAAGGDSGSAGRASRSDGTLGDGDGGDDVLGDDADNRVDDGDDDARNDARLLAQPRVPCSKTWCPNDPFRRIPRPGKASPGCWVGFRVLPPLPLPWPRPPAQCTPKTRCPSTPDLSIRVQSQFSSRNDSYFSLNLFIAAYAIKA